MDRRWCGALSAATDRRSERFFQERGSAAVFLARFVPPATIGMKARTGGMGMPPRRFFVFNLLAIALWAPVHIVPGMLAGTAYKRAGVIAEHLLLPVLAGLLAIGFLVWAFRRWRTQAPPPADGTSGPLAS